MPLIKRDSPHDEMIARLEREAVIYEWLGLFCFFLAAASFTWVMFKGLEREDRRQQVQAEWNCQHYGDAINQWATERGNPAPCDNPQTPEGN